MDENLVSIRHLNQFYGRKQALFDVSLDIRQGMFGLLGRNGAGKTTLMKILATLLPKRDGEVTVCGIPVENAREVRRMIGYLPQEFSMYPSMRVAEVMDYLGILSGMDGAARRARTERLLGQVNLAQQRNTRVKALSGGMKRRLGIAQALLNDPQLLIVDEPTAGLDPEERVRFRNLLSEVAQERIVILSTHIVGDIEAACEEIAILDQGRLLYSGTVGALLKTAAGRVFTKTEDKQALPLLRRQYAITGMHTQGDKAQIRLLSDAPVPDAEACEPNMEDAYMLYLYQNGASVESEGGEL